MRLHRMRVQLRRQRGLGERRGGARGLLVERATPLLVGGLLRYSGWVSGGVLFVCMSCVVGHYGVAFPVPADLAKLAHYLPASSTSGFKLVGFETYVRDFASKGRTMETSYLIAAGTLLLGLAGIAFFVLSQPAAPKKRSEGGGMKPRGSAGPHLHQALARTCTSPPGAH